MGDGGWVGWGVDGWVDEGMNSCRLCAEHWEGHDGGGPTRQAQSDPQSTPHPGGHLQARHQKGTEEAGDGP